MSTEQNPTPAPADEKPTSEQQKILFDLLGLQDDTPPEDPKPAEPAPPVEPEPAPAPEPKPKAKVTVRKAAPAEPQPSIEELVARGIAAAHKQTHPELPEESVPAPATLEIPADLNEEEREEIELAQYAESKDPAKAGLAKQLVEFHRGRAEYVAKQAENDPDYNPDEDPKLRAWLQKNQPKFSASEKRRLWQAKVVDDAAAAAEERVRKEYSAKLEQTEAKLREIEETPKLKAKIGSFNKELFSGDEDEAVKAFIEKGADAAEDFPIEAEVLSEIAADVQAQAEEYLAIRNRLKNYDANNPAHVRINKFVVEQADAMEKAAAKYRIRDGKQFVHPLKWKPELATTSWTFGEDDVLAALRVQAGRDAKTRIEKEHARLEKAAAAKAKRSAPAPNSAPAAAAAPAPTRSDAEDDSPLTPSAAPSNGKPAVKDPTLSLLGYET